VHVLRTGSAGQLAVYALQYDGRFVEDPIWFQLQTAGELLFSGRKAMTLFFARQSAGSHEADIDALNATKFLLAAIDSFASQ
jgi:hypothetical protein